MFITMKDLEDCCAKALETGSDNIAIYIENDDIPDLEVIINPYNNIEKKLEYFKKVYDEDLNHRHSEGIRIVGCTYGKTFAEIEENMQY